MKNRSKNFSPPSLLAGLGVMAALVWGASVAFASPSEASASSLRVVITHQEPADRRVPETSEVESSARHVDTAEAAAPPTIQQRSYEAHGAPAGTDALASLLRAYHAESLPTKSDLERLDPDGSRLLFIEAEAFLVMERQRALQLLSLRYEESSARARLLERAADASSFVSVRLVALRALGRVAPSSDREAQAVFQAAQKDANHRVRALAKEILDASR